MAMAELVASTEHITFELEIALETQIGARLLPFTGMDKQGAGVCVYFLQSGESGCNKGALCPLRHITGDKSVVCKHWLRGLCKKGDACEFLHEYDLTKMPECYFFSKYNACSNKECPFRHIDPETKIKDCPWYDRGFCRHGPACKARHRRRALCPYFLNGFCPTGKKLCKLSHPSFDIPKPDAMEAARRMFQGSIVCHNCHERGHKASYCPNLPAGLQPKPLPRMPFLLRPGQPPVLEKKPISHVTCYKCGEKGHYANKCPKGNLAFLGDKSHLTQEIRQRDEATGITLPMAPRNPAGYGHPANMPALRTRHGEMKR